MKQFYCILTIALCLLVVNTFAQQVLLQQTVTDASKGQIVLTEKVSTQSPINESVILGGTSKSPNINWRPLSRLLLGRTLEFLKRLKNFYLMVFKHPEPHCMVIAPRQSLKFRLTMILWRLRLT